MPLDNVFEQFFYWSKVIKMYLSEIFKANSGPLASKYVFKQVSRHLLVLSLNRESRPRLMPLVEPMLLCRLNILSDYLKFWGNYPINVFLFDCLLCWD